MYHRYPLFMERAGQQGTKRVELVEHFFEPKTHGEVDAWWKSHGEVLQFFNNGCSTGKKRSDSSTSFWPEFDGSVFLTPPRRKKMAGMLDNWCLNTKVWLHFECLTHQSTNIYYISDNCHCFQPHKFYTFILHTNKKNRAFWSPPATLYQGTAWKASWSCSDLGAADLTKHVVCLPNKQENR